jgi:hypothetical protein
VLALLIASACVAFVLSLPIGATRAGQTLRKWAAVLLLAAFLPALFVGLVRTMQVASGSAPDGGSAIGTIFGLLVLSPIAYAILQLRKRLTPKGRDAWADYVDRKAAGKKLVDPKAAKPVLPGGTFGPFGGSP